MLRLTLRSKRTGRFLARIIDRSGTAFVLDYGDAQVIEDASLKLSLGFTLVRAGAVVQALPEQSDFMGLLAEHYLHEGLLVFFEEPGWPGRPVEPDPDQAVDLPGLFEPDPNTEILSIEELPRYRQSIGAQRAVRGGELADEDLPTDVVSADDHTERVPRPEE